MKIFAHKYPIPERGSEIETLEALIDAFAAEMKHKLLMKYEQGFRGWNKLSRQEIYERICKEMHKANPDAVDLANFAAMFWNIKTAEEMKPRVIDL